MSIEAFQKLYFCILLLSLLFVLLMFDNIFFHLIECVSRLGGEGSLDYDLYDGVGIHLAFCPAIFVCDNYLAGEILTYDLFSLD